MLQIIIYTMKVKVTYGMDIGHRENQEDAIRIDEEVYQEDNLIVLEEIYEAPAIFTVCDWYGGAWNQEK